MSKFKVGDSVKRKDGNDFSDGSRVQKIDAINEIDQFARLKNGTWELMECLERTKTPRKHADLIHRWADDDSMVIECFYPHENDWFIEPLRAFIPSVKYREYDPERKNTERMIEKLENELKELKEKLNND